MRKSTDKYVNGRLMKGFNYDNQAWGMSGRYVACGIFGHEHGEK